MTIRRINNVSMPSNGLHPFLLDTDADGNQVITCQCPQTGYIHFYKTEHKKFTDDICVNALKRATSISTQRERL